MRDHVTDDYPVIWDCATSLRMRKTVGTPESLCRKGAGLRSRFRKPVAHRRCSADACPSTTLTAFKVRGPSDGGTVTILQQQPLFTALAGKTFFNRARRSITPAITTPTNCRARPGRGGNGSHRRYGDGGIAIGLRHLGKGRVICSRQPVLGAILRQAGGLWPGEDQDAFSRTSCIGSASSRWPPPHAQGLREHYLANNGTEEYLANVDPYPDPGDVSTDWTTVHPVQSIYDPKNGQTMAAATFKGQWRSSR